MWVELFTAIAGLGNAPWVAGGDWNAEPHEVWAHVLDPRVGGYLPGPALRQPTCYPPSGEPRELDFLLVSRSLARCVVGYHVGDPGVFPVHCGVTLQLQLAGLNRPVPTLRRPRAIPELPTGGAPGPGLGAPWGATRHGAAGVGRVDPQG